MPHSSWRSKPRSSASPASAESGISRTGPRWAVRSAARRLRPAPNLRRSLRRERAPPTQRRSRAKAGAHLGGRTGSRRNWLFQNRPLSGLTPYLGRMLATAVFQIGWVLERAESAQNAATTSCNPTGRMAPIEDSRLDREPGGALAACVVRFASKPLPAPVVPRPPALFCRADPVTPRVLPPPAAESLFWHGG